MIIIARSGELPKAISDTRDILLLGSGYQTADEAEEAARRWTGALQVALARIRVGADFGALSKSGGFFTRAGLDWVRSMTGSEDDRPMLQERLGLHVYPCEPPPRFARFGGVYATVAQPVWRFENALRSAIAKPPLFDEREELAYHLFSASFFQRSSDLRFLSLMMAIETLIQLQARPDAVRFHVQSMIAATKAAAIDSDQKTSIVSQLNFLLSESIGQAGRRLAQTLEGREYEGEAPVKFFTGATTCGVASCMASVRGRRPRRSTPRPPPLKSSLQTC